MSLPGWYQERMSGRRRSLRCDFQLPAAANTAWSFSVAASDGSSAIGARMPMPAAVMRSITAPRIASFDPK